MTVQSILNIGPAWLEFAFGLIAATVTAWQWHNGKLSAAWGSLDRAENPRQFYTFGSLRLVFFTAIAIIGAVRLLG